MKTLFENSMDMEQMDMFTRGNNEHVGIVDWLFDDIQIFNDQYSNNEIICNVQCHTNESDNDIVGIKIHAYESNISTLSFIINYYNEPTLNDISKKTTISVFNNNDDSTSNEYHGGNGEMLPQSGVDKINTNLDIFSKSVIGIPPKLMSEVLEKIQEICEIQEKLNKEFKR